MDAHAAKIISALVMLLLTFLSGFLPNRLFRWAQRRKSHDEAKRKRRTDLITSLLLSFGGGVLLATAFLHLIPEVQERLDESIRKGGFPDIHFPLVGVAVCCGIFLVCLVDEVAQAAVRCYSSRHHHRDHSTKEHLCSTSLSDVSNFSSRKVTPEIGASINGTVGKFQYTFDGSSYFDKAKVPNGHWQVEEPSKPFTVVKETSCCEGIDNPTFSDDTNTNGIQKIGNGVSQTSCLPNGIEDHTTKSTSAEKKISNGIHSNPDLLNADAERASHGHSGHSHSVPMHTIADSSVAGAAKSLLVIVALSAHCVLEGMAIGLENTASDVWLLMFAILIHKLVVIFCIGLEMASVSLKLTLHVLYIFMFSIMSPVGVMIAMFVADSLSKSNPFQEGVLGLLQALGAGTLLYVVFFEILEKERHANTNGILKLFVVILGFVCLACLLFIDHGHDHGSHAACLDGSLHGHDHHDHDHHDHGHDHHDHDREDHGHDHDHGHDDHDHGHDH